MNLFYFHVERNNCYSFQFTYQQARANYAIITIKRTKLPTGFEVTQDSD